MEKMVEIKNLQESNIEDLIYVCSSKKLTDPVHQQGIKLKKKWLREMLAKYGSIAKIAYLNGKPVGHILYYPEEADVRKAFKRKNVLVIHCIYNPFPEAQKLGVGKELLRCVVQDVKLGRSCLGNKPCKFILAKAFDTGEFLPMTKFYVKNGFLPTMEQNTLYLPIEASYEPPKPAGEYEPLPEDKGKAAIFYGPTCQFSYPFAKEIEKIIKEVAPDVKIRLINEWENPEEAIKRRNAWLVVNARLIRTFFMETEKFKEEIRQAVS